MQKCFAELIMSNIQFKITTTEIVSMFNNNRDIDFNVIEKL